MIQHLLTLLLLSSASSVVTATWNVGYDAIVCPYHETAINYYLGTRDACTCENKHTFFLPGRIPFFRLGADIECQRRIDEDRMIEFDMTYRGGFVDTRICHDLDATTTACFFGSYFLTPEWVFTFEHVPQSCFVEVNGVQCESCAFIGRPPVSAMAWDCGDMLPGDFDFNQQYPNEVSRLDEFMSEQLDALLVQNKNSTGTRRRRGLGARP